MMETSIDEGAGDREGEAEEEQVRPLAPSSPAAVGRGGTHCREVTNQLVVVPGSGMISSKHRAESLQHLWSAARRPES